MLKILPLILALLATFISTTRGQAQDPVAGETVFKKCKACHQVGPEAKHRAGPILNDAVGRAAGTAEGFKYRKDIVAAGEKGLVWDEAHLLEYLNDPTEFLRNYLDDPKARSAMSFKLKDQTDRLDVIAFLSTATTEAAPETEADANSAAATPDAPATPEMSVEEVIAAQEFADEFLADLANIEAGKEIWFAQCTHCHGFKAYPGKAPKLKPAKYKPTFVFKRVYKGFKKMPAWRESFSVEEIRQVVAYVKSSGFAP